LVLKISPIVIATSSVQNKQNYQDDAVTNPQENNYSLFKDGRKGESDVI